MQEKSFFERLFDFSFSQFITLQVIPFLYGLSMILLAIGAVKQGFGGFKAGFFHGLWSLCVAVLALVVAVIVLRIVCETTVVFFRIAENTRRIADQQRPSVGPQPQA